MKETWANDLKQHNVHITSNVINGVPTHPGLTITRTDTGEIIQNVADLVIEARPGSIIWATLTLLHIDNERKEVLRETVSIENPELDMVARSHLDKTWDMTCSVEDRHPLLEAVLN